MKQYTMTFKSYYGNWQYETFMATCDTDARFTARMIFRRENAKWACGFSLMDFNGKYIDL